MVQATVEMIVSNVNMVMNNVKMLIKLLCMNENEKICYNAITFGARE